MSTRSAIIRRTPEGTFEGVYCHSDGYLEYVGRVLENHYADSAKVVALIALGDLSALGPDLGEQHDFNWMTRTSIEGWASDPRYSLTRAYHRDRGDELNVARGPTWQSVARQIGHDGYVYLFLDGQWSVSVGDRKPVPLSEALAAKT